MPVIPGLHGSAIPAATTASSGKSYAYTARENISNYTHNSPTASSATINTMDKSKADDKQNSSTNRSEKIGKLIAVAKSELAKNVVEGAKDNQGNANIEKYWSATEKSLGAASGYKSAWAWCAAFVSWCIKEAGVFSEEIRPKESGAKRFGPDLTDKPRGNWYDNRGGKHWSVYTKKPKKVYAGDLVVYSNSHIGICIEGSDESGIFITIEGNTNPDTDDSDATRIERDGAGLYRKKRLVSSVNYTVTLYPESVELAKKNSALVSDIA
jgi:hypothetical protein